MHRVLTNPYLAVLLVPVDAVLLILRLVVIERSGDAVAGRRQPERLHLEGVVVVLRVVH